MLWRNSPAIIVGKNQNTLAEINQDYLDDKQIPVVRRLTGGGAVYHDLGNINYTIIEKDKGEHFSDYSYFTGGLIEFLASLGVKAELKGRNDVIIDDEKICGNAQCVDGYLIMHHGCILYQADLAFLNQALRVKAQRFSDKSVKSNKAVVTNIFDHLPKEKQKSPVEFLLAFGRFMEKQQALEEYILTSEDIKEIEKLQKEKYQTWRWNYGFSPKYNFTNSERFSFGTIEVDLLIAQGVIEECQLTGSFFSKKDITELQKVICHCKHEKQELTTKLSSIEIGNYISGCTRQQLVDLLIK